MINWNYNADDYTATNTNLLDEGEYRVRIINATETVAKHGTEGIEILFQVKGHSNKLRYYIWYNREYAARTNQLLGELFDSFGILPKEQKACENWIGKRGAVYVMHDIYKGRKIAKTAFCLNREQQAKLPAWEDDTPERNNISTTKANRIANDAPYVPRQFGDIVF